ncbi:MAG: class I SAM-dependent methyltransferase [Anaerolineales bacterium]|nr:class I SAM-dependent methyltransferase [Anaerolineales bacterium]
MVTEEIAGTVILKKGRDKPLRQRHPWVFSGAIEKVEGKPAGGALVEVRSASSDWLAVGYFNEQSQIRVRCLSYRPDENIDETFWRQRLEQAINGRAGLFQPGYNSACRLVNAESDGLPGLVVDRYDNYLVMQCLTKGIDRRKQMLADLLANLLPVQGIFERSDVAVRRKEGLPQRTGHLVGSAPAEPLSVWVAGVQLLVDIQSGHKTGLYLDQRDNYEILRQMGVFPEREVLNLFSFTGGFGLHAVQAGARAVTHVDSSIPALEAAEANVQLNGWLDRPADEYLAGDAFDVLHDYQQTGRQFDTIILDPPKFAHSQGDIERATRGYKELNRLAFLLLRPGGYLATFSCSGLVSAELFQKVVFSALADSGRDGQIVRWLHQASDHPVSLYFPEGAYLKGLLCRVF